MCNVVQGVCNPLAETFDSFTYLAKGMPESAYKVIEFLRWVTHGWFLDTKGAL